MAATIQRQTASQQVLELVRARIVSGDYAPGSKLDENRLAAELGVSRTPLREALFGLERDGLLVHEPYRGRVVAASDDAIVAETFPILGALEGLALRCRTAPQKETLDRLDALNEKMGRADLSRRRRHVLDQAWHAAIVADCGNRRLVEMIERLRALAARHDGGPARGLADVEGSTREHAEIAAALRAGDRETAARAIEAHWAHGIEVIARWRAEHP